MDKLNKKFEDILKEKAEKDYKIKFIDELYDNDIIDMCTRIKFYKYLEVKF